MLELIAEILFAALILVGIWHREKLIAFEDALSDRLAHWVAGVICRRRAARARKARAAQRNHRTALRAVKGQGRANGRSIA